MGFMPNIDRWFSCWRFLLLGHSNLSPAATFGALVAGQLLPGTMASAGPALRPAGQLLLENTRGKDSMFMLLRWNTLGM